MATETSTLQLPAQPPLTPALSDGAEEGVEELTDFVLAHPRLLVLTGAGCSTASGIPDYRDARGDWKHRQPVRYQAFVAQESVRRRYWAGSMIGWERVRGASPGGAHVALARLEELGHIHQLVTQNVDGLHHRAGSRDVLELHGRLDSVACLACGAHVKRSDVQDLLLAWNRGWADEAAVHAPDGDARTKASLDGFRVPDCPTCGGILKPSVVFFGESVPKGRVERVFAALVKSDGVLVVGSSLMVFSAYRFCVATREADKPVAAINLGRTRADADLALKVEADCGRTLSGLADSLARIS